MQNPNARLTARVLARRVDEGRNMRLAVSRVGVNRCCKGAKPRSPPRVLENEIEMSLRGRG